MCNLVTLLGAETGIILVTNGMGNHFKWNGKLVGWNVLNYYIRIVCQMNGPADVSVKNSEDSVLGHKWRVKGSIRAVDFVAVMHGTVYVQSTSVPPFELLLPVPLYNLAKLSMILNSTFDHIFTIAATIFLQQILNLDCNLQQDLRNQI